MTPSLIFFTPIRYDNVGAKHNMMGMIDDDAAYATEYGDSFPRPVHPGIYALNIDTTRDASLDSRKKEAFHKATVTEWEIYNVAKREANRFIARIIADSWIYPLLKGSPTFYAKKTTKELLDQIQVVCTGHHTIDLLTLQDEMRTMHVTTDTIPQYIAELHKAQMQAERAEIPTPDNYLMMVATKAML